MAYLRLLAIDQRFLCAQLQYVLNCINASPQPMNAVETVEVRGVRPRRPDPSIRAEQRVQREHARRAGGGAPLRRGALCREQREQRDPPPRPPPPPPPPPPPSHNSLAPPSPCSSDLSSGPCSDRLIDSGARAAGAVLRRLAQHRAARRPRAQPVAGARPPAAARRALLRRGGRPLGPLSARPLQALRPAHGAAHRGARRARGGVREAARPLGADVEGGAERPARFSVRRVAGAGPLHGRIM